MSAVETELNKVFAKRITCQQGHVLLIGQPLYAADIVSREFSWRFRQDNPWIYDKLWKCAAKGERCLNISVPYGLI